MTNRTSNHRSVNVDDRFYALPVVNGIFLDQRALQRRIGAPQPQHRDPRARHPAVVDKGLADKSALQLEDLAFLSLANAS